jgi:hypothetical protein
MKQCWQLAPSDRPSFDEIITKVEDYLEDLKQYTKPNANSEEPPVLYYNLRSNKDSIDLPDTDMSSSDEVFQASLDGRSGSVLPKRIFRKGGGNRTWSETVFV